MSKQTINIGASPNDGTGTPLRTSFDYCNQNFTELYTATGPSGNNIVVPGNATITGAATVGTTLGVTGVSTFAAGSQSLPALTTTGDTNTGIYYPAADTVAVTTGGVERCRVDSSGYFGVGVFPSKPLQVKLDAVTSGAGWYIIGRLSNAAETKGVDIGYNNTSNLATISAISGGVSSGFEFWAYNGAWYKPATIDTSGNLSLSTGNVVMATSGKGIDFSATASGSGTMTSELLNDYEEGTFTPSITFGGASVGLTGSFNGRYTKVGRAVTVSGYIALTNKGSSTGGALITGLPFTSSNGAGSYVAISLRVSGITFTNVFAGYIGPNQTYINLDQITVLGVQSALSNSNFSNSSELIWNVTYDV